MVQAISNGFIYCYFAGSYASLVSENCYHLFAIWWVGSLSPVFSGRVSQVIENFLNQSVVFSCY